MRRANDQPEESNTAHPCKDCYASRLLSRRTVLKSALGLGVSLHFARVADSAETDPKKLRPQIGDVFIFSSGDHQGQVVTIRDLPEGGPPAFAYPLDPKTQTLRDGSRLNRVLFVHLAQTELTDPTRAVAAEGVVGYSAICPHTGCDVSGWKAETQHLVCPCHASTFDPKDRARVIGGPAPRPLPLLPLRTVDGKVTVAGAFSARVGAEQK
ncbi:MAG: Rieske 2Fe-2S domain-containing protein [Deltaproteobacteria bacterium]|nr:Rieske 2Fe-2S domain-containing protein [Deltaproteobacteria bacterium]